MLNMELLRDRKLLIDGILGSENKGRKAESLRQVEIFNDRLHQHVYEKLRNRFAADTVNRMPIVSSINLCRRIVKQEASIYKDSPSRQYTDANDNQAEIIDLIYHDMMADSKLRQSNESFKLQNQNHVMILPKDGKLIMRVLRNHHIDKIDDPEDPERAFGYVISTFDKDDFISKRQRDQGDTFGQTDQFVNQNSNDFNEKIGDPEDYQSGLNRFVVWTREHNFIMDRKGNILSGDDISSPIPGILPIVDISLEKDFEYWVRQGDMISDFTIEYNALMSDINNIVMMQGYSQAYMIGEHDTIPDNVQIGPTFVLKMGAEVDGVRPEFGFANPNSDIAGSINFAEILLANFLSSRGIDPKTVSGKGEANKFTSGIERLLAMIERFEASKCDYDTYRHAETQLYQVVKAWHNNLLPTNILDPMYKAPKIADSSRVQVSFSGPEMMQTDMDKVDMWQAKIDAGLASKVDAIMDIEDIDKDTAIERIQEIDELEGFGANKQEESDQENQFGEEFPSVE